MAYLYNAPICLHKLYENVCTNAWMYYIHIHSISAIIMVNFFSSFSPFLFFRLSQCCVQWHSNEEKLQRHKRKREAIAEKKTFFLYFTILRVIMLIFGWFFFCLSFIPFTEWPIKNCNRVEKEHKRSITFSCLCIDERNSELVNNKKCEWVLKC